MPRLCEGHVRKKNGRREDVDTTQSKERDDAAGVPVALVKVSAVARTWLIELVGEDRTRDGRAHDDRARRDRDCVYSALLRGVHATRTHERSRTFPCPEVI